MNSADLAEFIVLSLRERKYMEIDDVTYAINGAVFEVNKILGPGFLEKVYENALLVELHKKED